MNSIAIEMEYKLSVILEDESGSCGSQKVGYVHPPEAWEERQSHDNKKI